MDRLCFSEQAKKNMTASLCAELDRQKKGSHMNMKKVFYTILAAVLLTASLTGAAVYTRWAASLPQAETTTQKQREEAEKTGLSKEPQKAPETDDVASVTKNGVTISVRQTLADRTSARLVFTISGWKVPEGKHPSLMSEFKLEGNPGSYGASGEFYHKPFQWEDHVAKYPDGTPVPLDADGDPVCIYETDTGDLEYLITLNGDDLANCFGKKISLNISSLGISEHTDHTPLVEGPWNLSWTLTGSESTTVAAVDQPIGDTGILLKEVTLSPLTLDVLLQLKEEFTGFDTLEQFRPALVGYRTRDGQEHRDLMAGGSDIYEDRVQNLFRLRRSSDGILEPEQIDAVLFADWDESGKEILYTVALP